MPLPVFINQVTGKVKDLTCGCYYYCTGQTASAGDEVCPKKSQTYIQSIILSKVIVQCSSNKSNELGAIYNLLREIVPLSYCFEIDDCVNVNWCEVGR